MTHQEPPLIAPGTEVDHFRVMRLLGQGGMAQVYLARDTRLGRKVALKVIRPMALGSQDSIARFLFEARATARFNHPHIVTIFAVGEYLGRPYVALEYLEGHTLKERLDEGRPSVREALRIALAIAESLAEAHRNQILHRDLKPENVVIPRDGRLRVVDFGLAKSLDASIKEPRDGIGEPKDIAELEQTVTQDVFISNEHGLRGTPQYMSPEQWMGHECSEATDVWALGLVLFEMLAGRLPFVAQSAMSLAVMVCDPEEVSDVRTLAEVPEEISVLTKRCLHKDPGERISVGEIVESLEEMLEQRPHRISSSRSPFRGLLPFSERHSEFFYGRDAEINAFLERLREEPIIPIVGPSGAGKSSFVQAGIIPRLREQGRWIILRLRPGSNPLRGLSAKLKFGESTIEDRTLPSLPPPEKARDTNSHVERLEEEEELREALFTSPTMLNLHLQRLATQHQAKVLLFVDQLEELYTMVDDDDLRRAFMTALCTAADDPQEPVRVVFTLRDDFLGRLAEGPDAREVLSHVVVIRSPERSALEEILVKPLAAVGYKYDDPELVSEMVDLVGGEAACLPLLQFVTRTLWDRREQGSKLLLRKVYDEVGGVAGALAYHADNVLEGMSFEQIVMTRQMLLSLVTPDGTRRSVPRPEVLAGLEEEAGQMLDRLIQARLISIRKTFGKEQVDAVLELAHESLIRKWDRLSRWVDESREELSFLAEVEQAATLWIRRGRREDELWSDDALREAQRNLTIVAARASDAALQFISAGTKRQQQSERRLRRRRLLWTAGLVAITCSAVVIAVAFAKQNQRLDEQRLQERQRRAEVEREGALRALEGGAYLEARARLRTALEVHDSTLGRALWWRVSKMPRLWSRRVPSAAYDADFSPSGATLAVAAQDKAIHIYDVTTGRTVQTLRGHRDQVFSVTFSPDGKSIASGTWSGSIRLWDLSRRRAKTFDGPSDQVWRLRFSNDGKLLASLSTHNLIRLWDVSTLKQITTLESLDQISDMEFGGDKTIIATDVVGRVLIWKAPWGESAPRELEVPQAHAMDLSSDDKTLAISSLDGSLRVLDVNTGHTIEELPTAEDVADTVTMSPDGKLLAYGGLSGEIVLWDREHKQRRSILSHSEDIGRRLAFNPNSTRLVSVGYNGKITLWDATMSSERAPPGGHSETTWVTAFDPLGQRLASAGEDGTIRYWDIESGQVEGVIEGHTKGVTALAYTSDGSRLASGSEDMTIRVWYANSEVVNRVFAAHDDVVTSIHFSDGDRRLISSSSDTSIVTWDMVLRIPLKVMDQDSIVHRIVLSPDGQRVGSANHDGSVRTWELVTGLQDKAFQSLSPVWGVDYLDSSTLVFAGEDGEIISWNTDINESQVVGRHPGRVYWLSAHPRKRQVATAGSDGFARLWDLDTRTSTIIEGHRAEVNSVTYSADGSMVATTSDDGTVRLWESDTGFPIWRCPLLIQRSSGESTSLQLLTHQGWSTFSDGALTTRDVETQWEQRLAKAARTASLSPSGDTLCVRTHEDTLEIWDVPHDKLLSSTSLTRFRSTQALDKGCVTLADRGVRYHSREGKVRVLHESRVSAVSIDDSSEDEVLMASMGQVIVISTNGEERERFETGPRSRAMLRTAQWLVVGFENGSIELVPRYSEGAPPPYSFQGTPSSPVASLLLGPSETLVAGFANGLVGLWDLKTGFNLWHDQLHGSVVHLARKGPEIYAASDLGHFKAIDLSTFELDECELLDQIWQRVPYVWRGSAPILSEPPRAHPRCPRDGTP